VFRQVTEAAAQAQGTGYCQTEGQSTLPQNAEAACASRQPISSNERRLIERRLRRGYYGRWRGWCAIAKPQVHRVGRRNRRCHRNNAGFGQGWPNIQRQQGNKPGDVRDLVRFGPTNFVDVARVFGLRGIRVEEPSQIAPALQEALASDETVVVDVATDIDARAPEPWLPAGA
jgi:hypothetical protein